MDQLRIGWAETSITPDKSVFLVGQFAERISEYVEKPLTATAMAVEGDDQMVIVSVDAGVIGENLVDAIRERLAGNKVGLDPMKVVYCATHSHTSPSYTSANRLEACACANSFRSFLERELPKDKKYIEKVPVEGNPEIVTDDEMLALLTERLTKVALEAWSKRAPGSYTNAFGRAAVGMCRRVVYSDGSAQMWGDTNTATFTKVEGGSDSGMELLYVFDENRALSGIVATVACPAQCVQHRLFMSPDYWGEAKMLLRKRFGEHIFLLGLCGIAGDQCPVDLVRWVQPESDVNDPNINRGTPPKRKADPSMFDLAGMRKAGKRVADEIIGVFEEGLDEPQEAAVFEHQVHMMQLPLRRVTLSDVENARKAIRDYFRDKDGDVDYNDAAKLQRHLGTLRRAEQQEQVEVIDAEVHLVRLGSIAIATNPFEPFLVYGNQILARSLAEQTFLVQLANGTEGYLPTEDAEKGGHYSAFVASGVVGHAGGEQMVRETLKGINGMFSK